MPRMTYLDHSDYLTSEQPRIDPEILDTCIDRNDYLASEQPRLDRSPTTIQEDSPSIFLATRTHTIDEIGRRYGFTIQTAWNKQVIAQTTPDHFATLGDRNDALEARIAELEELYLTLDIRFKIDLTMTIHYTMKAGKETYTGTMKHNADHAMRTIAKRIASRHEICPPILHHGMDNNGNHHFTPLGLGEKHRNSLK